MFNFFADFGNYEERRVGRYDNESGDRMVSTARVSDGQHPFETAFKHPDYNNGKMGIVEAYDTKEEAEAGHARWETVMRDGPLPDELVDCCNSGVSQLADAVGCDIRFPRQPT